ncbi:TolC family protein [Fluoribacter gormanii]|uniref:Outer membrane channel protein n=1 Tax=Fluoribacter gormanii TaxID=464 RepID=A0A377GN29_9GAMM|nr:TolC family protein [Fluoribacter gormanii]KTD04786.1 outer membrane channel protein [Fluoribacter gormanii]SIR17143.1 Outer membrane protein TolC [Fluoribacter gormanii]STO26211.1 outer membrane channel protein [Fluoribacter gormanii]
MLLSCHIIKKYLILIVIACSLSTTLWAHTEQPISYPHAVKQALSHNPSIQSAKTSIEAAYGALKQANSMSWPQLGLELNGTRSNNPLSVFGYKLSQGNASFADFGANQYTGPSTLFTRPNALNHPGYYSNLDTAFKLTLPIYSGGKIKAQQENTRALLISAQHGNQQAQNQLAYQLYVSYEGFLTANQLIHVAQQQVTRAKEFLATTKALRKQSLALDSDVLMAEAYLNSSSLGLSSARLQAENELDNFRTLMGNPNSYLIPSQHTTLRKRNSRLNTLISQALEENASIKALRSHIKAEKANILASQSLYKPQVNLQLRHDWNGYTLGSGLPSDTIAVGANWTLFSAGERAGAVQSATAKAKKAQFELDEQRNQLKLLLRQLTRNETQFNYELQLSRQMAEKEAEVIKKLNKRFGRGLIPLSALLESQMKLTQSKAQELQTLHQLRLTQAHILMLTNQLIPKAITKA